MSTITTNSINSASVRFTCNDYMSNCCSHAEYYGQFDSPAVRNAILSVTSKLVVNSKMMGVF